MAIKIKSVPHLSGELAKEFNSNADTAMKKKGKVDFSKHIETASKILAKAKLK